MENGPHWRTPISSVHTMSEEKYLNSCGWAFWRKGRERDLGVVGWQNVGQNPQDLWLILPRMKCEIDWRSGKVCGKMDRVGWILVISSSWSVSKYNIYFHSHFLFQNYLFSRLRGFVWTRKQFSRFRIMLLRRIIEWASRTPRRDHGCSRFVMLRSQTRWVSSQCFLYYLYQAINRNQSWIYSR